MVPRVIDFRAELPRLPTGKLHKQGLRISKGRDMTFTAVCTELSGEDAIELQNLDTAPLEPAAVRNVVHAASANFPGVRGCWKRGVVCQSSKVKQRTDLFQLIVGQLPGSRCRIRLHLARFSRARDD
jgi:hypothetical protein